MTLSDLERMKAAGIDLSQVAKIFGYERTRFHTRLRRGGPEITPDEAEKIEAWLREHGLKPSQDQPNPHPR